MTNNKTIVESLKNVSSIVICLSVMSCKPFRKMKQIEQDAVLMIMTGIGKVETSSS